ncbi:MAG TPA: FecR domain-containing protein [Candidatus Saccharicenans sp.]|nr:FecR domain-containing protein [Candidatus Saccharicenans sp.]HPU93652.1 FecR domain-containing protein [Candidatus Saccharicenans sp.]
MSKVKSAILILVFACLVVQPVQAGHKPYNLVSGEKGFYYAFISYLPETGTRSPEIIRPGLALPEIATLNFPLGPGDIIVTYDRPCEIQFDSGSVVRLDVNTQLKIETIMAQSLSSESQLSNLNLLRGHVYLMYTAYDNWEVFQLLTPLAAIKLNNHSVIMAAVEENGDNKILVKEGKAQILYGPESDKLKTISLKKVNGLVINTENQISHTKGFLELASFESWNNEINKRFTELHKGVTPLPQPVQKLPSAVFYFAQHYSNTYGEWIWDDYLGYVWRPFYNDYYPWGNWSPYIYGQWTYLNGSLFWVPQEPWGWVPYHLGIWQWDKEKGWLWIPGSTFAPAWAVWDFYFGHYSWRPWVMTDWLLWENPDYWYYSFGMTPYYSGGWNPAPDNQIAYLYKNKISSGMLKKNRTFPLPLTGEYKSSLKNLLKGLEKGEPKALEKISVKSGMAVIVDSETLASRHLGAEKVLSSQAISELKQKNVEMTPGSPANRVKTAGELAKHEFLKQRMAVISSGQGQPGAAGEDQPVRTMRPIGTRGITNPGMSDEKGRVDIDTSKARPISTTSSQRFRDWNPDIRVAKRLGIRITYDSARNSIVAPQLGLSSREARGMRIRVTPRGIVEAGPSRLSSGNNYMPDSVPGPTNGPAQVRTSTSAGSLRAPVKEKASTSQEKN